MVMCGLLSCLEFLDDRDGLPDVFFSCSAGVASAALASGFEGLKTVLERKDYVLQFAHGWLCAPVSRLDVTFLSDRFKESVSKQLRLYGVGCLRRLCRRFTHDDRPRSG